MLEIRFWITVFGVFYASREAETAMPARWSTPSDRLLILTATADRRARLDRPLRAAAPRRAPAQTRVCRPSTTSFRTLFRMRVPCRFDPGI